MLVVSLSPFRVASLLWQPKQGAWVMTVVCKATYDLFPVEARLADEQEHPNEEDNHWDDDAARSVYSPNDLVPFKRRADVVLVGNAFSPRGEPVRALVARLVAGGVDKAVEVHGERQWTADGLLREATPFLSMPLRYERAAGGADTANPVGLRVGPAGEGQGAVSVPNLLPPGITPQPRDTIEPVGFGPIAAAWRSRRELLGAHAASFVDRDMHRHPLPEGIDPGYFNVAPPDQQVAELRPDERIVLENLHPDHRRLVTSLPGLRPRAFVERRAATPQELALVCDTLWIDTNRSLCTLTWRGQLPLESPSAQGRVIVAMEVAGQRLSWADVERLGQIAREVRGTLEMDASPEPSADPPRPEGRDLRAVLEERVDPGDGLVAQVEAALAAPATPPGGSPPVRVSEPPPGGLRPPAVRLVAGTPARPALPPTEVMSAIPPLSESSAVPPPSAVPGAPGVTVPETNVAWPPGATPANAVVPARMPGGSPTRESARPPASGSVPPGPVLPTLTSAVATAPLPLPRPSTVPEELRQTEPGPQPPAPSPQAISVGPAALSAPISSMPTKESEPAIPVRAARSAGANAAITVPLRATPPVAAFPTVPGVASAARDPLGRSSLAVTPRVESAVAASPAREALELLWFEPSAARTIRSRFKAILYEINLEAPPEPDRGPEESIDRRDTFRELADRRDLARVLARGEPMPAAALDEALSRAVDPFGAFVPPLVLLAGTLTFSFDETAAPERALIEQRKYPRRVVFGETFARALLTPVGSRTPIVTYLPDPAATRLPMFTTVATKIVAELHVQQDQYEACSTALRVLALGRVVSIPGTAD